MWCHLDKWPHIQMCQKHGSYTCRNLQKCSAQWGIPACLYMYGRILPTRIGRKFPAHLRSVGNLCIKCFKFMLNSAWNSENMLNVMTLLHLISADCPTDEGSDFNENLLWIIPVAVIVGLLILGAIILAIVLLIVCITVSGFLSSFFR